MIQEMMREARRAISGYMQCGEPTPPLEWVMHPSAFAALRLEVSDQSGVGIGQLLQQRRDGVWEFAHHPIREDRDQTGWRLQPERGMSDADMNAGRDQILETLQRVSGNRPAVALIMLMSAALAMTRNAGAPDDKAAKVLEALAAANPRPFRQ